MEVCYKQESEKEQTWGTWAPGACTCVCPATWHKARVYPPASIHMASLGGSDITPETLTHAISRPCPTQPHSSSAQAHTQDPGTHCIPYTRSAHPEPTQAQPLCSSNLQVLVWWRDP